MLIVMVMSLKNHVTSYYNGFISRILSPVIIMVLFQVLFTTDSNVSSFSIEISFSFSSELG